MPKVEALSEGREDATFVKINVDENPELAKKYGIRGIPTFMVFNEGGEVTTITAADMEAIKAALDDLA
jgi:thioredoxin 1